jgi:hypothetical protein
MLKSTPVTRPQLARPQAPQVNATLAKILGADPSGARHPFIKDGDYLFEVQKCEEKSFSGTTIVIELKVLESEAVREDVKPNPVNETVAYLNNITKSTSAAGNLKAFFLALVGVEDSDPSFGDTLAECLGSEQLAAGMLIYGRTYRSIIKSGANAGKEFVGVNWTHYEPSAEPSEPSSTPPKTLKI